MSGVRFCASRATSIATGLISGGASAAKRFATHHIQHDFAPQKRATEQEVMEAIWVAAEMRASAAYAHANLAIDTMNHVAAKQAGD